MKIKQGWTAVAAIALILGATACSSSDDTAADTTDTSAMPAPMTPAPDAGAAAAPTAGNMPEGMTVAMVTAGESAYKTGICIACHGVDATGTPNAPNLTDTEWLNSDGSFDAIKMTIKMGVMTPKVHPAPMPPMGGGQLTDAQIADIAAYIYSISHKG